MVFEAFDSPQWKFAEEDTCVRTFNGPYNDLLAMRPTHGSTMEGTGDSMLVQDSTLKRAKCNRGTLTVNLVGSSPGSAPPVPGAPLKTVVEIDWVAVQKDLKASPIWQTGNSTTTLIDYSGWARIEKWKNEPNLQLKIGGTEAAPVYKFKDEDGTEVTLNGAETKAARKILRGVEGYNIYAPIVKKTTTYSRQPTPGTAGFRQEDVPVTVDIPDGYEWLKTACRDTQNQDKTWQRSEEWTGADEWDADLYPVVNP